MIDSWCTRSMASGIQHLALNVTPRHNSSHLAACHFKLCFGTIFMQMSADRPISSSASIQRCTGTLLQPQDTVPRRTLSLTWSIMILLDTFLQKTTCIYSLVFTHLPSIIPLPDTSTESIVQAFHGLDSSIIRCSYNPHVRSGGGGGQLKSNVSHHMTTPSM